MQLAMSVADMEAFMVREFPQVAESFTIDALWPMGARLRMRVDDANLRPGGTVSGPAMFTIADCAFYFAVLAMIGPQALTVTTTCTINFLRKPALADLICEARILKLGKLLATGDATVYSAGVEAPVAHATLTYAIPPKK